MRPAASNELTAERQVTDNLTRPFFCVCDLPTVRRDAAVRGLHRQALPRSWPLQRECLVLGRRLLSEKAVRTRALVGDIAFVVSTLASLG